MEEESGLTLLEVLVAVMILGVVIVTVFNLFTVGTRLEGDSARHTEALRLAEAELEEVKAVPYAAVSSDAEPREVSGQYGDYEMTVTVDEHDLGKTVTVTVLYRDGERERTVTLSMERGRK